MSLRTLMMAGTALGLAIAGGSDARAGMMQPGNGNGDTRGEVAIEAPPPTGTVAIGGVQQQPVRSDVDEEGNFEIFQAFSTDEAAGNISGGGNVDPGQVFTLAFTDLGGPTAIAAGLISPITPIAGLVSVFGDWSISVSDFLPSGLGSGDGGTIAGGGPTGVFVAFDINGVFVLTTGPLSITYPAGASSLVFGPFPGGPIIVDCAALLDGDPLDLKCNSMSTLIAFTGAGGSDGYGVSTTLTIVPVAEPVTLSVLGLGLLGLGGALRRRSRSA